MAEDLNEAVARLRKSAALLNEITDRANGTIRAIEEFLSKCNVGVSAYILVRDSNEQEQYLAYKRTGGRFRITVVWNPASDPSAETEVPWSDCARDVKLDTIKFLPSLVNAIAGRAEETLIQAREAIDTANALLTAMKEGK